MSVDARLTSKRWLIATTLAVSAAITAACGTTVPLSQQLSQPGQLSGPASGAPPDNQSGAVGAPGGQATAQGGTALAGSSPRGGLSGTTGGQTATGSRPQAGPSAPTSGASAVGVTATTITIGAMTSNGAGTYQRAAGFSAGASGDQVAMVRSVVNWLNARGGIAGRKIKLVVYDVPTGDAAANPTSAYEAACTALTQDGKVFAVASIISQVTPNFYECLRKHGVLVVTADSPLSSRFFRQYAGTVYAPINPSYTRVLADSVDALWADGWLTSTSKVGVVGFDTPDAHATVTDGLIPALKRHGLGIASDFYTSPDSSGASAYSGGVLKFQTNGVDRVFFAPGGQPIYFGLAAQQQAYQPFMEMSTLEYPGPVANTLPAAAMNGAAGVGWSPYLDLDNASAAKVATPAKAACVDAVKSAQQDLTTGTTLAIATWICDDWFFLRDALAHAPSITLSGFRTGVSALGSSYLPANTYRTLFAPNRTPDGAAAYGLIKFHADCRCFRYATGLRPLP